MKRPRRNDPGAEMDSASAPRDAFPLQAQAFDEGIGEGTVMQILDLIRKLGRAARGDSHSTVLTLKTGCRPVTGTQVSAGIEKQNDISRAAFFQLFDHVSHFDPGSGDIAGIRAHLARLGARW